MNLFKKNKPNIQPKSPKNKPEVPTGLCVKCSSCKKTVYSKDIGKFKLCPECNYSFRLSAMERIKLIADKNSFVEFDKNMIAKNPLNYPSYEEKIKSSRDATSINDAVVTGKCEIYGNETTIAVMDSNFIMGSMGSVVGEKLTRLFEYSTGNNLPVIVFTASGGARMQEGILSLMQMAKISASIQRHSEKGLLYISYLTDPTTGGVTASFAMLGDIILSEPGALIGFAGPRVIEQTIKQKLPKGFQTAEFLLEHGFVDKIIERKDMKEVLSNILKLHSFKEDKAND